MERFFPIVRVLSALHRCQLQTNHLDQMIFVNKNWPFDLRIGCFKPFNLANACELELTLIKRNWCKIWICGWITRISFIFYNSFDWIMIFLVPHSPNIGVDLNFFILFILILMWIIDFFSQLFCILGFGYLM
jgi:hypothetical protein